MNLRNRPVRLVAAIGAVLAAGTTTFMALAAGTASADEPGRCTQNVNVREDPEADAKIVALCEAGKQVKLGEERDGFVHLDELGGWASKDYVKADEDAASSDHDADRAGSEGDADQGDTDSGATGDVGRTTGANLGTGSGDNSSSNGGGDGLGGLLG